MNDIKVSNANTYSHQVQFEGDPQDVRSADVSGAEKTGGPSAGSRGVTMTRTGQPAAPSVGSDKNVLVVPEHPATLSEIEEASDAMSNFLIGLKQKDDEDGIVNKGGLNQQWKLKSAKKAEETELVIHKVLSEVDTVSNKSAAVSAQIGTQAQILIRKNAEDNAKKTADGRSKALQWTEIGLKALGTLVGMGEGFIGSNSQVKIGGVTRTLTIRAKKSLLEAGSKLIDLTGDIAHLYQVREDADDNVVRTNQDEAIRSMMQNVSNGVQNVVKIAHDTGDKALEVMDRIRTEMREAEKKIHVTSN